MRVFGPIPWGVAVDEPARMVATPVGARCLKCGEAVVLGDAGMVGTLSTASGERSLCVQHRECFLRDIVGSVGHQRGLCSCYGGNEEDPPSMSRREAARAACVMAGVRLL